MVWEKEPGVDGAVSICDSSERGVSILDSESSVT